MKYLFIQKHANRRAIFLSVLKTSVNFVSENFDALKELSFSNVRDGVGKFQL